MEKKSIYMTPAVEELESRLDCPVAQGVSGMGGDEDDDNTDELD